MSWLPCYVGGLAESAAQAIAWSDQQIKDLDIPIMKQALTLQDKIFALADQAGIGPQVRQIVYGIRTYEYGAVLAQNIVPPAATAAAGSVLAGVGGAAALGAVGIAAVVLSDIFGGDEDYSQKQKQAAEFAEMISRRLSLQELAAEQDANAKTQEALAPGVKAGIIAGSYDAMMQAADTAHKLANFYRLADQQLSGSEQAMFVSLSNIGRWDAARKTLQAGVSLADPFAAAEMPNILSKIVPQLEVERARFQKLAAAQNGPSLFVPLAVIAASGAAGYFFLMPVAALSLYHGALSLGGAALRMATSWIPKVRI